MVFKNTTQEDVLNYLKVIPSGITFVHGKAGSGKTFMINRLVGMIPGCQVLTPTNLAASLYKGARTLHSFFHGAFDGLDEGYQNPQNLDGRDLSMISYTLKNIKMIIIDEVSMVRADLFEMMNQICQKTMGNTRPFGNIPVVVVGDLFQLPPIVSDEEVLKYLKSEYGGIYFFNSHVIQNEIRHIRYFELTKSHRQANDPEFVKILDAFRQPMSANKKVEIMNLINSRVTNILPSDAIYVASSNEEVRQVNTKKLSELPGTETTIDAEYTILKRDRTDHVVLKHSQLPSNEDILEIIVPSSYDSQLTFKIGARVMFCKNSRHAGYINGDFGIVENFNGNFFSIRLEKNNQIVYCPSPTDRYRNSQMNEYRYEMEYNPAKHRLARKTPFIQKTNQFPLKLAYAFTIHKAQGQTYEKVILDLNSHIFAPGQLYVALSRAKSLQGLFLTKPVTYSDIISDDSIFEFLARIRDYNGMGGFINSITTMHKNVSNSISNGFIDFVLSNEKSPSMQQYMVHTINCYQTMVNNLEYEKALWELKKIKDLMLSAYQIGSNIEILHNMKKYEISKEGCQHALKEIYNIYIRIVNCSHKQYQTENRTIMFDLSNN